MRTPRSFLCLIAFCLAWTLACERPTEPAVAASPPATSNPSVARQQPKKPVPEVPPPSAMNGFDLRGALVPVDEIARGGPPRDGIPAIDRPKFIAPEQADFLKPDDLVVSVSFGEEVRAYPLRILVWHEIANDAIGTNHFAVTYCPLCGTCMVFDRAVGGRVLDWGVSGLLYKSDVLMYDRQTESLWSQLKMRAVAGKLKGTPLRLLPTEHLTWAAWRGRYPQGKVLSTDTGFKRRYQTMPYRGYEQREAVMFPVGPIRDDLPNKEWVVGLLTGSGPWAVPLKRAGSGPVFIGQGSDRITLRYDPATGLVTATNAAGQTVPHVKAYWFAWQAFYPETRIIPPAQTPRSAGPQK